MAVPSAPIGLTGEYNSLKKYIQLNWNNTFIGTVIGYKIYKKEFIWQLKATITNILYYDSSVNFGGIYYYKVLAYNNDGDSDFSNEIVLTIPILNTKGINTNYFGDHKIINNIKLDEEDITNIGAK